MNMNKFNYFHFSNPDAFYRPGYIWFWNDRITRKNLRSQLKDMADHGAKSVWPFAWPNFRPLSNPTSMSPDYLSKEYFQLYKFMIQEANRLGMKAWLYDEGGWPSGGVCGRIVRENPALAQQSLARTEIKPKRGETVNIPSDCLSAYLYQGNSLDRQLKPGDQVRVKVKNSRILVFQNHCHSEANLTNTPYPDLLNPKTTREFLKLTHEQYRKVVGRYFGNTIPMVFADEPKVNNPPWTDGLAIEFKKAKGYDITLHLPSIFEGNSRQDMQTRIDFFDWWSSRYAESFFGQIQKWCRKYNLLSAGHLGGEDDTLGPLHQGYGHTMRMYRKLDIPGVDTIWRQVFPLRKGMLKNIPKDYSHQMKNHHFPKYASSVAHQDGKPWVITESFAVYGAGLTPAEMKWVTDFQYVRGVNIMTLGGYPLSTRDHYMGGQRPGFGPTNPLWKYMDIYHDYTARMSYLLSLGKPDIENAVYYPIRDIWAKGPDVKQIAASNDELVRRLAERQADFDFVDDDILESNSTKTVKGGLKVGPMIYRKIFLSRTRWISDASRKKLAAFVKAGGTLVWMDKPDDTPPLKGSISVDASRLEKHIDPLVDISPAQKSIRVCKRKLANGNFYFITNEGLNSTRFNIHFPDSLSPVIFDPEKGSCYSPADARPEGNGWIIPMNLEFAGSCVVFFGKTDFPNLSDSSYRGKTLLNLPAKWTARKFHEYRIEKKNFEIVDLSKTKSVSVKPGDWQSLLGKEYSGDVEYSTTFDCPVSKIKTAGFLDLGKVNYACEVFLNGKNLGRKIWAPFVFPIHDAIRAGKNELRIIVTNTMANQFTTTKVLDRWPSNIIGPYHRIAKFFEGESMPSGLFGPVRICTAKK
jgi:hypothetical protein